MKVTLLLLLTFSLALGGRIENSEEVEQKDSKEVEQQWRNSEEGQGKTSAEGGQSQEIQSSASEKVSDDGGHSSDLSSWSRFKDIWLNLSGFHLIFIPVIFLTLFFVILVAIYSPFNAHSHYLVDETKGGALYGVGGGGHAHGGGLRGKSNNVDAAVTKRVLEGIEKMQELQKSKLKQLR